MTCTGPDCTRLAVAGGLCDAHRRQQQRGKPLTSLRLWRATTTGSTPQACVTFLGLADGTLSARLVIPEGCTDDLAAIATACREVADALDGAR